jgi:hypothetical protein
MEAFDIKKIKKVDFPESQYFQTEHGKDQIYIHHTVSGVGVEGDLSWWIQTTDRVATAMIIHHDGTPYQCFSSKFWAHHLGVTGKFLKDKGFPDWETRNVTLNQRSIGIEIDSMGGLTEHNGKWYMSKWDADEKKNVPNLRVHVKEENVQFYPQGFKGFEAFEKYTNAAIETVAGLLILWCRGYGIPATYNQDMWDISNRALQGQKGIWNHTSVRADKSDCHPDPRLIKMLKELNRWI